MPSAAWWESDRRYFSLVAERVPIDGGVLFVSASFADLPPGFVASVPGAAEVREPRCWLSGLEGHAAEAGAPLLRAYLPPEPSALARVLEEVGFTARPEVGVRLPTGASVCPHPGDRVSPIASDADWDEELAVQRTVERPWGDVDPERWVALERAQAAAGCIRHLVRHDGVPVGSFGQVAGDPLRRPKSLVVHAGHRGRGHAATALSYAGTAGEPDDGRALAAIAVEGGPGHRSYHRLGLRPSFRFVEWSRAA